MMMAATGPGRGDEAPKASATGRDRRSRGGSGAGSAFYTIRTEGAAARMVTFSLSGMFGSAGLVSRIGC